MMAKKKVPNEPQKLTKEDDIAYASKYLTLIENSQDIIFTLDFKGRFTFVNKQVHDLLGYQQEELLEKSILQITTKESTPLIKDYLSKAAAATVIIGMEIDFRARDFQIKTFSLNMTPLRQNGKITELNGIARDITEEKKLQLQKEEAEEAVRLYLETVLENIPSALVVLDEGQRCTFVNKAFYQYFGKQDCLDKTLIQFMPFPLISEHNLSMKIRKAYVEQSNIKEIAFTQKGRHYIAEVIVAERGKAAAAVAAGGKIAIVIIINDVTEQKNHEEEVQHVNATLEKNINLIKERNKDLTLSREAMIALSKQRQETIGRLNSVNKELARLNKMKSEFAALASHELKVPNRNVLEAVEEILADTDNMPKRLQKKLGVIAENSRRVKQQIQHVLSLVRREVTEEGIIIEPVDFQEVIPTLLEFGLGTIAAKKKISLKHSIGSNLPKVMCNQNKIVEVLTNLIENAIKYNEKGTTIKVTAREKGSYFVLGIKDNGRGISKQHLPHLFEKGYRATAKKKDTEGSGLGLYICKEIIDAHHGAIQVASTLGKGTTFTVKLPIKGPIRKTAVPHLKETAAVAVVTALVFLGVFLSVSNGASLMTGAVVTDIAPIGISGTALPIILVVLSFCTALAAIWWGGSE
jgi:PAS domain S-box-containing protein